ncbi:V-type ATP synthase subunit A [Finegoldia magna]|uniref:V-type ATP synthase alpha chain n=1 Tax=Finegoldia magna (strain ATCC 29328 / DSM 20472 / WAL 2508) TaxID=334413 RepID=B0S2J4_FINM2|nr:V-type ATP synthase subunit A [Finegoldia magna]EXF26477.1 ATP synthase subunit A [Finegoldia magna ALB8]MDU1010158.1 V-type ATP synthase subunit A [Finegoldia magna]MDU1086808.1 V-type ATP synthase subunit A [Finegoldia magna]MDU5070165.1 V-type ATP synthase subunit A [Finegoldia magna]MDU7165537.1 V-type ATP synthase subunit A [Finegoldia magna]
MNNGKIFSINGPVIKGRNMTDFTAKEMVLIGEKKLIGEVISLEDDIAVIQVYEETEGLKKDDEIYHTNKPLSLKLGPGLLKNMFDGIERPLKEIRDKFSTFIPEGIGLISIDEEKLWDVTIKVKNGDTVTQGQIIAEVPETEAIVHKIMIPVGVNGTVKNVLENGKYNIETTIMQVEDDFGNLTDIKLYQDWPIRIPRPSKERLDVDRLLETGQRILDVFFPLAKGGTVAIPGGFGTGKTMTQHQLAKYADADIIIYIGCGERGNEMTEVLEDFPKLIDPNNGKPLMERTVLIANTSNMPVAAREASIYTGITMAEYFRDMGYDVAIMADSTSRWAEALREISGRLEEMPAEEGYPAYLPSRIAQFYERAGIVKTLNDNEGSVTIIGAVSPAGGDFSEPVTENTKRFVNVFLGLDKDLAYSRHYPAINWMSSYSSYVEKLRDYYESKLGEDVVDLRNQMLKLLYEEDKLKEIVMLVGEDVLPDDQRLILDISNVMKLGFLQQNAFSKVDTYVPLKKQVEMLKTIKLLYEEGRKAIKEQIPISQVKNADLYSKVIAMKNTISNEDLSGIKDLNDEIKEFYSDLISKYEK